tara:strand:- start:289 stop:489 length:201 start_codon:yes stop_codon:yes gene_type:complete
VTEGKRNHNQTDSEEKKFSIPFSMGGMKENITLNTNKQPKPSKEQIIKQAFKFHSQGNISEAAKLI